MRALAALIALALIGAGVFWFLTAPARLDAGIGREMDEPGDAKAGEIVFHAAGCAACHAKPTSRRSLAAAGVEDAVRADHAPKHFARSR